MFDLFSGIGGFRLGLESVGFRCVGSCEINRYARQIYSNHYEEPEYSDIREVDASILPDFDILCAGFPCQAFSNAGKRMGFADTRGTMFFEIARVAKEKRPETLLLENVRGLLMHDRGKTFITILNTLDELGYDAEWQVINGKYFVPQNRERVFIVGHSRGKPIREVFPITEGGELDDGAPQEEQGEGERVRDAYCRALDANYWKGWGGGRTMIQVNRDIHQGCRYYDINGISPTLLTMNGGGNRIKIKSDGIRCLTPLECERLMGFPDGWTDVGVANTQRYKCLGNAVIPAVVEMIGEKLMLNI